MVIKQNLKLRARPEKSLAVFKIIETREGVRLHQIAEEKLGRIVGRNSRGTMIPVPPLSFAGLRSSSAKML